jgi:hypothetical protein
LPTDGSIDGPNSIDFEVEFSLRPLDARLLEPLLLELDSIDEAPFELWPLLRSLLEVRSSKAADPPVSAFMFAGFIDTPDPESASAGTSMVREPPESLGSDRLVNGVRGCD